MTILISVEILFRDKLVNFRDTAKVELRYLEFDNNSRQPDEKNVKRLKDFFKLEDGCDLYPADNYIKAIISDEILYNALRFSSLAENDLLGLDPFKLIFSNEVRFKCLNRKYRSEIATELLNLIEI
jgi:hypothetical protein